MNGDGITDFLVGRDIASSAILYGSTTLSPGTQDLGTLAPDGSDGFIFAHNGYWSATGTGDVNNDGLDDFLNGSFGLDWLNGGAGADDVAEALVIYRPTGQILWALIDGAGQDEINLQIAGQIYDLTL